MFTSFQNFKVLNNVRVLTGLVIANLIESKFNKFLEAQKIENSTFKQNENISIKYEKKTVTENYSYFTTIYQSSCSIRFQKRIASLFQKHNINIKPAYTSKKFPDFFSNKSKFSEVFDANVIYKYTCSADQSIS